MEINDILRGGEIMSYHINNEPVSKYFFQEMLLDAIRDYPVEDFDEFLDEVHEPIKIMGITYDASFVLQNVDPIAYDIEMEEYFNCLYHNYMYELKTGSELEVNGTTFKIE